MFVADAVVSGFLGGAGFTSDPKSFDLGGYSRSLFNGADHHLPDLKHGGFLKYSAFAALGNAF